MVGADFGGHSDEARRYLCLRPAGFCDDGRQLAVSCTRHSPPLPGKRSLAALAALQPLTSYPPGAFRGSLNVPNNVFALREYPVNSPELAGKFALGADPFAAHFVGLGLHCVVKRVADRLRSAGLVTLGGLTTHAAVLAFSQQIMVIQRQRNSGPDGLAAIYNTGRHDERPGFAGLTNEELSLHTEGTALQSPPRLVLLVCTQPASRGGQALLVDSRTPYAELAERHPDAVTVLSGPRAGFFGPSTWVFAPAFAHHEGRWVSVRYRQDSLVRWNPLAQMHLHEFRMATERNQQMLPLEAGQRYLIDNHRWLHARTAFKGARRCYRALGYPSTPAPPGFIPASAGGAA
ncbi:TauD/TfdA family dioxygenase [Streptomyces sp. URMC 127]|uniref:TauD/TfdA family dioxygenase n=1 Tax=Streptomyces sp. URMC 127 TaxID=3423402 RepID=UPI003F1B3494